MFFSSLPFSENYFVLIGDYRDYNLSLQLIETLVTPSMFSVSSWMDSRHKTPAKSLQARAFSLGKPLLPATSSPSPSHATSPGQILSQFPGHIEAVLWPPFPGSGDVMTKNTN